ncbi:endonuclease/exonuclease/phosphatase family protein [Sphingobacterium faecale]|uniref:Endonuclease/exonuclease/phosphatase family protein n=1 Tax=Sphingobacterium faecale TaxID=2803775 RepID=A0ABS1R6E5_9SPHI|nr:endonuclease/exonuclease/phosphatase family protein [Sphingobacterium faecale]MBL1410129.1 endonuclease/exonuclease/phosphatase family protein [Sphingobacterium faecale]
MLYILFLFILIVLFILFFRKGRGVLISEVLNSIDMEYRQEGNLRVLTYNVAGLPQRLSSASTPRRKSMEIIGEFLNSYDIANIQEDFNYNSSLFAKSLHPYRTLHKGKVPFGDGLSTLSKFPILEYRRIPWKACHGADCLTPKGFSYIRVQLSKSITIDVYNLHANAHDTVRSARARNLNLDQLAKYIHDHSLERPLLVMGDFNAHYSNGLDSMSDFCRRTQLKDVWVELENRNEIPAVDPFFIAKDMLSLTNKAESLDKILYRNNPHFKFTPILYDIERKIFRNEINQPLSDHLAVMVSLKWEYKFDQ